MIFRKIIFFGLEQYFDYVVTSEEAGIDKPSKAPFELALKKLDLLPDDENLSFFEKLAEED